LLSAETHGERVFRKSSATTARSNRPRVELRSSKQFVQGPLACGVGRSRGLHAIAVEFQRLHERDWFNVAGPRASFASLTAGWAAGR